MRATRPGAAVGTSLLLTFLAVGVAVLSEGRAAPSASDQLGANGLTAAQVDEMVSAHNAWRRPVGARPLRWSAALALRAQARAEYLAAHGCFIKHGPLPRNVGENLFRVSPVRFTGGRSDERFFVSPTQVVDSWGGELADYDPMRDICAWNRQCGHYTQIVWATTKEVGCGMSVCPTLGQVWVCNYRPAGNIRVVR